MTGFGNLARDCLPGLSGIKEEAIIQTASDYDLRAKLLAEFAWQRDSFLPVDLVRVLADEHTFVAFMTLYPTALHLIPLATILLDELSTFPLQRKSPVRWGV